MSTVLPPSNLVHPGVLVVTGNTARANAVCQQVLELLPTARVFHAHHTLDAMRRCLRLRLHLVVLDWGVDGAGGPALERHLARCRPELPVIACDDAPPEGRSWRQVTDWQTLPLALERWLLRSHAWLATDLDESLH
jgi:hypothetical protein